MGNGQSNIFLQGHVWVAVPVQAGAGRFRLFRVDKVDAPITNLGSHMRDRHCPKPGTRAFISGAYPTQAAIMALRARMAGGQPRMTEVQYCLLFQSLACVLTSYICRGLPNTVEIGHASMATTTTAGHARMLAAQWYAEGSEVEVIEIDIPASPIFDIPEQLMQLPGNGDMTQEMPYLYTLLRHTNPALACDVFGDSLSAQEDLVAMNAFKEACQEGFQGMLYHRKDQLGDTWFSWRKAFAAQAPYTWWHREAHFLRQCLVTGQARVRLARSLKRNGVHLSFPDKAFGEIP